MENQDNKDDNKVYIYFYKGDKVYAKAFEFRDDSIDEDFSDEIMKQIGIGLRLSLKQVYAKDS